MGSAAERHVISFGQLEQLREARSVVQQEADALVDLARRIDSTFCEALHVLASCAGCVIVTGMGKAGLIGQKIAATLSSTGTRAHFLHPAEAVHGSLGCLHRHDVLLTLSNSGETDEICRLIPTVRQMGVPIIAITAVSSSTLGTEADVTLELGRLREAGAHGLAPSTTTTAMLALGDALALVLSRMKGFTPQQFAVFHPAGSLGRKLKTVGDMMRTAGEMRIAPETSTIRQVFVGLGRPGRRTGAVMLVDAEQRLSGIFTDSDLARLLEQRRDGQLDRPIHESMTPRPLTTRADALILEVVEILSARKVSELPVVDGDGRPIGLIDITDVIGEVPGEADAA